MLSKESILERITNKEAKPCLIPKAFSLLEEDEIPAAFTSYAHRWVPIPAFETLRGSVQVALDHSRTCGLACDEAGAKHLRALQDSMKGYDAVAILTIGGQPAAALKRTGYGEPNVLSFRYQEHTDANRTTYTLIPGGIYTTTPEIVDRALIDRSTRPFIAADKGSFYPAAMFLEQTNPLTAKRTYTLAESLFERMSRI